MKKKNFISMLVFIMKMIAGKEDTLDGFLNRMEELKDIIQNKEKYKTDKPC